MPIKYPQFSCPHCTNTTFRRIREDIVELYKDDDVIFEKVIDDSITDYNCEECDKFIKESELTKIILK